MRLTRAATRISRPIFSKDLVSSPTTSSPTYKQVIETNCQMTIQWENFWKQREKWACLLLKTFSFFKICVHLEFLTMRWKTRVGVANKRENRRQASKNVFSEDNENSVLVFIRISENAKSVYKNCKRNGKRNIGYIFYYVYLWTRFLSFKRVSTIQFWTIMR